MEFIDLKTQYSSLKDEINNALTRVMNHGQFINGPEIAELEQKMIDFTGARFAIGCGNGTDALFLALLTLDLPKGAEIITTPFTFIATGEMIELLGLKAVFVDIDPQTYNINPHAITKAITAQTKAIIAVSLYGQCADFKAINAIAMQHNLTVIEDAAQSMGASQSGCKSGSLSSLSTTSFFPSKPLGCYGDGGMIFTDNEQMANKLKMLRNHGQIKRYEHQIIGVNSRLDTMQAAILLVKLTIFEKEIELRQEKANYYNENLENIVAIPYIAENNKSVYAQYTININERDELREFLANNNIPTTIHYPKPLHLQPAFANYNLTEGSFSISEQAARKVLSLPMSPYITNKDQDYIIKKIKEFYGK